MDVDILTKIDDLSQRERDLSFLAAEIEAVNARLQRLLGIHQTLKPQYDALKREIEAYRTERIPPAQGQSSPIAETPATNPE